MTNPSSQNGAQNASATAPTRPVRVAVTNPRYHPIVGGSELQARLVNQQFAKRANGAVTIPFIVTGRFGDALAAIDTIDGIPVHRVGPTGLSARAHYQYYFAALRFLVARKNEYDVIHGYATGMPGFFVTLAGAIARKPVILRLATSGELVAGLNAHKKKGSVLGRLRNKLHTRLGQFTAARAHIVALCDEGVDELNAVGARFPHRIGCGVDTTVFRPLPPSDRDALRREMGFAPDDLVLVLTGRFVQRKGIDVLLPAFRRVLETLQKSSDGVAPRLRLCFSGSGHLQADSVEPLIDQAVADLPRHVFKLTPRTPVAPYLQMADAFVFPSRKEGLPNVVLEALAVGLPCLLSDIAPHQEIKRDNPDAPITLYPTGDEDALYDVLLHFAQNAQGGGPRASQLAPQFQINGVVDRYIALYHEVSGIGCWVLGVGEETENSQSATTATPSPATYNTQYPTPNTREGAAR